MEKTSERAAMVAQQKQATPPGPWHDEPDKREWRHKGVPCLILRQPHMLHLCGYVAVPAGHPWHGKGGEDIEADAHGGVNFASPCHGEVCHVPAPGEADDVWWLGFDACHAWDLAPGNPFARGDGHTSYKGVPFMKAECERLAEQALAAAAEGSP